MPMNKIGIILLRLGLAFVFFYAAIGGLISPNDWIGWLPVFLQSTLILNLFSVIEIIMGLWILSGYQSFWAGIFSGFMLLGIVILNSHLMLVVFRDIGLALAAFALAFLSSNNKS